MATGPVSSGHGHGHTTTRHRRRARTGCTPWSRPRLGRCVCSCWCEPRDCPSPVPAFMMPPCGTNVWQSWQQAFPQMSHPQPAAIAIVPRQPSSRRAAHRGHLCRGSESCVYQPERLLCRRRRCTGWQAVASIPAVLGSTRFRAQCRAASVTWCAIPRCGNTAEHLELALRLRTSAPLADDVNAASPCSSMPFVQQGPVGDSRRFLVAHGASHGPARHWLRSYARQRGCSAARYQPSLPMSSAAMGRFHYVTECSNAGGCALDKDDPAPRPAKPHDAHAAGSRAHEGGGAGSAAQPTGPNAASRSFSRLCAASPASCVEGCSNAFKRGMSRDRVMGNV